ncbi:VWA domain-containing protein [Rhabdochromatium marinum]|uniref:VWA domain-containing protein n=1 Tax=Rhabdochromatium marinum TaxID=48729 RepID=UPI001903EECC|nr:vWA domain-containing protein [Rhabdochromatium marinum]
MLTLARLTVALALLFGPLSVVASSDLRMLIDVSGSMRQNDPQNLRVPALRLVSELLPLDNQAGVWLFANAPQPLVAPGVVDEAWKQRTRGQLRRIHSNGNYTNIESAINAALEGWSSPPAADEERYLILLTDGLVDVPDVAGENSDAASRQRILDSTIPRLQDLQVKTNVVALSDQVDAALVEALTQQTGGWLEVAEDSEALQRAFLRMLEQSAPPTTVPIEGNRFTIDTGVREFTLLAFHAPGEPVSLITPDGKTITAGRIPLAGAMSVSWNDGQDYDLVTITAPTPGEWELQGSLDPDNRVAVMTDLGLAMEPLPNSIPTQANFVLELWPTEQGSPIKLKDFLNLASAKVEFNVTAQHTETSASSDPAAAPQGFNQQGSAQSAAGSLPLAAPSATIPALALMLPLDPNTLTYRMDVQSGTLMPGTYRVRALLESPTFKRQITRSLRVTGNPLKISYQPDMPPPGELGDAQLGVQLEFDSKLIRPGSLFGYLRLEGPEGNDSVLEFNALSRDSTHYEIPITRAGAYSASARLRAETVAGEALILESPRESFLFDFRDGRPPKTANKGATDEISWPLLAAVVGGGTLAFAALIGLVLLITRAPSATTNKKAKKKGQSSDDTADDDDDDEGEALT